MARTNLDFKPEIRPELGLRVVDGNNSDESNASAEDSVRLLRENEQNPDRATNTNDSISSLEDKPSNIIQGPWNNKVTANGILKKAASRRFGSFINKKNGPIVAIISLIVMAIVGLGMAAPGLAFFQLKNTFLGFGNDSSAPLSSRTQRLWRAKFDTKNAFSESSTGKCNLRCMTGSINESTLNNLKAKGFDVETTAGSGIFKNRYTIDSLTFPDKVTKVTTGAEFDKAMLEPKNMSKFNRVFNSKTAFFLNSKFVTILKTKFGISKVGKLTEALKSKTQDKATDIKEKIKQSMREMLGYDAETAKSNTIAVKEKILSNVKVQAALQKVESVTKASSKVTGITGWICAGYDVSKGLSYAVKITKIAAFASFAMIFLNYADQMMAGDGDPDVTAALGEQLTEKDENGISMMDSLGYRMAAFGDTGTLTDEQEKYSIQPTGNILGAIGKITSVIAATAITISIFRDICKYTNSTAVGIAESCAAEIGAAVTAMLASIEVGGVAGLGPIAICVAKVAAMGLIIGTVIGSAVGIATDAFVEGEVPIVDDTTIGEAGGDALYSGTSSIHNGMSASYGMKAGTAAEIKEFVAATATINAKQEEVAIYEAKDTPFDISNQYSFLGSIAQKLNLGAFYNSSFFSGLKNLLAIIPRSFASLSGNANAAESKAALYTNKCDDSGLKSVNVDGDAFCNPSYVMSSSEINADIDDVIDYMTNGATPYISPDDGSVIAGTDYQKYMDYCANRVDPLGETGLSISDDDYEWAVGLRCTEQSTMLSNFRTYTMDKSILDTVEES